MKIMVTGSCGYIGSELVNNLLAQEAYEKVIGVDNLMYDNTFVLKSHLQNKDFEFHKIDIRDTYNLLPLLRKSDVIVHCAALVGAPVCDKFPQDAWETNETATINMLRYLSNNQYFVYLCSNSGYGTKPGFSYCSEKDELNPISVYGISKCNAEKKVTEKYNAVSLRLATVCGLSMRPRFDLLVNNWTAKLLYDRSIVLYQPEFKRNSVHIKDVIRAINFVKNKKLCGVYNVADPKGNLTKLDLATLISSKLGLPEKSLTIGSGEDPDQRDCFVNVSKIKGVGFEFENTVDNAIEEIQKFCYYTNKETCMSMGNV